MDAATRELMRQLREWARDYPHEVEAIVAAHREWERRREAQREEARA